MINDSWDINGAKILITGHTGFKGSWLTQLLSTKNVELYGLSLKPEKNSLYLKLKKKNFAKEYFYDISNKKRIQKAIRDIKPDFVFHLAAQPLVLESYQSPIQTFETNVMGTANILEACLRTDSVRKVVVATTDKVYKNLETGKKYSEVDPLEGLDPYSASKVGSESVIKAWQNLAQIEGRLEITSVRAGNVIGGGDFAKDRLLPDVIRSYINQEPVHIRNPESTRPWQHVLDPLAGYILALKKKENYERFPAYNFGPNEESLSVRSVLTVAKLALDSKIDIVELESQQSHEASKLDLDSTKAFSQLGWRNSWSQEKAVEDTIRWWKDTLSRELSHEEACQRDINFLLKSQKL